MLQTPSKSRDATTARDTTDKDCSDVPVELPRLTKSEERCLSAFLLLTKRMGCTPKQSDVARHLGLSTPSIGSTARKLEDKGYLDICPQGAVRILRKPNGQAVRLVFVECSEDVL